MRTAVFSSRGYDRHFLSKANEGHGHELVFYEPRLDVDTAPLAHDFPVVCPFVNDDLSRDTMAALAMGGTRLVALRSAGFNNVDLVAAYDHGIRVTRVPAYSPYAVAEYALALILALNRKLQRAYTRVRDGNFSLDGLLGFDLHGRTIGLVGTGLIGSTMAGILAGFGVRLLAHDPYPNQRVSELGARYVDLHELFSESDIISLHCPLTPETRHMIDRHAVDQMKRGVMLINTSRGGLVDSRAVIDGLKSGKIGYLGLDVYEEETELFSYDLSGEVIQDDVLSRLLTMPNVIVTAHQGFFTIDALDEIAATTLQNIADFEAGRELVNEICLEPEQRERRAA